MAYSRQTDAAGDLLDERRRLLEYVLEQHKTRGGRVQLPIGMSAAEPWLLDAVDVAALLGALHHAKPFAVIDLLLYCSKGSRALAATDSAAAGGPDGADASDDGDGDAAPVLALPQLQTGLSEGEVAALAYLVFAANCANGADAELLSTVRSQLGVDEARAKEVARLLELVRTTFARMKQATGALPVSNLWTANLELPVCLLGVVLPKDFNRFRSFVVWRDTLSHVLLATLAQSVRDSWSAQLAAGNPAAPTAQQLMARLKASLRRVDVRDADDFDEAEYRTAARAVGEHAYAIVQCTTAGWALPWGLRARLCEMLLRGVFDTLDESEYIEGADAYLQLLQTRLWPLLGISPAMHNAGFAWIHFRQFVLTRHPGLVSKTKALLKRLAQLAAAQAATQQSQQLAGAAPPGSAAADAASPEDAVLTQRVGGAVIDWTLERLSDYHDRLPVLGGADCLPGLADVMAFAALSRGDGSDDVGDLVAGAIRSSVSKELQRRLADAMVPGSSEAARLAVMCSTVRQLAEEQVEVWARGFTGQLLEAAPLALAVLHAAVGARFLPWLGALSTLDDEACAVLRAAMALEPQLLGPILAAAPACQHEPTRRALQAAKPWDAPAQLQPVLAAWVANQISGFAVWVDRQLQQEDWRPLGVEQPHSGSARELRRIVMESLEALFGLDLPLPAAIVSMHMEGIDNMMHRYLETILEQLGSWTVMVPPLPPLTRYKREVAIKQEEAESGMPGLPLALPPPGFTSKKGATFLQSVPRTEQEPCSKRVEAASPEKLVVMMASLGYLLDTLQPISNAVAEKWREAGRSSGGGGGAASASPGRLDNPFSGSSGSRNGGGGGAGRGAIGRPAANGHRHTSSWGEALTSWGGSWGLSDAGAGADGSAAAGAGGGARLTGGGAGGAMRGEELFGALLEAAAQSLRSGIAAVTKWLAVRVVWWDQRAAWCELLYRHRVTSCRLDWLLHGLSNTLGDVALLLPQGPRLDVAAAVLREVAAALERVLLDGGPCRWFIPADAAHLSEDVDGLRRLFFAEGDGLAVQDVNTALVGVAALLQLMSQPTGPLLEAHRAARRAALLTCSSAAGLDASSPAATGGSPRRGAQHQQPGSSKLGPLAARLKPAASLPLAGMSGSGGSLTPQLTGASAVCVLETGRTGGGSGSSSPRGGLGGGWAAAGTRHSSTAALVAAGGDVGSSEPILLRVLCHRADHAASKYLKEAARVPKSRDETLGEALGRFTRFTRA